MYAHQYHAKIRHLAEPEFGRAKRIRIWVNGDIYNNSYEVCINPNRLRTWNSILLHITHILNANFGAVRNIVSVKSKKCIKCFADLENHGKYIAVGYVNSIKFEKHRYKTVPKNESKKKCVKKFYSGDLNVKEKEFWVETKKRKLTVIFILVNGRRCQSPTKVVLTETDLLMWDVVLEFLSKMLDVPDGIQYIYTIFGDIIYDPPEELQHGCLYVAVAFNEKYETMDYISLFNDWEPTRKNGYLLGIRPANAASVRLPVRKRGGTKIDISQEPDVENHKVPVTENGNVLKKNESNETANDVNKDPHMADIQEDSEKKIKLSVTKSILKANDTQTSRLAQQNINVEDETQYFSVSKANTIVSDLSAFGTIAELDSHGGSISSDSLSADVPSRAMRGVSGVNYMDSSYSHAHYRFKTDSNITDTDSYQIPKNYIASGKSKENAENMSEFISRMKAIKRCSKFEDMQDNKTLILKNQASEVISTKYTGEISSMTCNNSEKAVQATVPDDSTRCCTINKISSGISIHDSKCMRHQNLYVQTLQNKKETKDAVNEIGNICKPDSEIVKPIDKSLETMVAKTISEGTSEGDSEKSKCMEELLDEIVYRIYGIAEKASREANNNEEVNNTNNINCCTIKSDSKEETKQDNLNDAGKKPFTKLNGNESNNGGITAALSKDNLCTADKAIKSIHIRNRTDINFCDPSKPRSGSCCQVFKEEVVKKIYDDKDYSSTDETCCSSSETEKRESKEPKCCFCYSGNKQKKYKPASKTEKSEEENIMKNKNCLYNKIFVGFLDTELRNKNPRVFCSCSNISVDSIEEDTSEYQ